MLVKLKREIIRMDHPAIQPAAGRAPGVDARHAQALARPGPRRRGPPVALLDTRNAFEVDHGSFDGAHRLAHRQVHAISRRRLPKHRDELAGKTVVSFCTGGIRCEKAAHLHARGRLADVLQLEGGILKYFEQVGGAHYHGECFVFDEREALAPDLSARSAGASARATEDPDIAIKR